MEAFESFVAIAMESEGFVVSPAVMFPVTRRTAKAAYAETQTHGFEVDLVGARGDRLVLATVKSFLGSRGVVAEHVTGETTQGRFPKLYALLNDPAVRDAVVRGAAERFGYRVSKIQIRLYVGRFAGRSQGKHEARIRQWCAQQKIGVGPIEVIGIDDVVTRVRQEAESKQYRDNPVLVSLKVLQEAGLLDPPTVANAGST